MSNHPYITGLCPADAAAVDQLIEARAAGTGAAPGDVRSRQAAALLGLLSRCPVEDPPTDLAARTLARLAGRSAMAPAAGAGRWRLGPADAQALDDLLAASQTAEASPLPNLKLPRSDAPDAATDRRQAVAGLLTLLDRLPAEAPPGDLAERTLAHIAAERQRRVFARQVQALATPASSFRWRELVAVAAVMMIGISLLWPVLAQSRQQAQQAACQANLASAGGALRRYAADHQGLLPRGKVDPTQTWWNVGQVTDPDAPVASNSAHLYLLVRLRYVDPGTLNCPGNPYAPQHMTAAMRDWPNPQAPSYSYQNQWAGPVSVEQPRSLLPVLSDRNPLLGPSLTNAHRLRFLYDLDPLTNSRFHDGRGQNILDSGGGVAFSPSPLFRGDNIWTIRGVEDWEGTEAPQQPDDFHVAP